MCVINSGNSGSSGSSGNATGASNTGGGSTPTLAAQLSLGASTVGAVGAFAGSIFAAQSDKINLNLQARIAELNSDMAQDNARASLQQGDSQITQARYQTGMLKAKQVAATAANGVVVGDGSSLNNLVSTDVMGEIDANTIRQNAVRAAAGYRTQATNFSNTALTKRAASSAISPFVSGLTSLATSAPKVAGDWLALAKAGALNRPKTGAV